VLASVTQCGGNARAIPLRVGRIDATAAGPFGVPGPFTPIEPTLAQFASAGFSQTETIGLVYDLGFFISVMVKNINSSIGPADIPWEVFIIQIFRKLVNAASCMLEVQTNFDSGSKCCEFHKVSSVLYCPDFACLSV
jgi:hypothetical protein